MKYFLYDIETKGLCETHIGAQKEKAELHVLSYMILDEKLNCVKKDSVPPNKIKELLTSLPKNIIYVGHNIINYDNPVLYKAYNFHIPWYKSIDTLSLSWYLFPDQELHGLESYGKKLKLYKTEIEDWYNLSYEEYKVRCERDVAINYLIFKTFMNYLHKIYNKPIKHILTYLSFNMQNLYEQYMHGIYLNKELVKKCKYSLEFEITEKIKTLKEIMPKVVEKTQPKNIYKKDGTLSKRGEAWIELLKERGLSLNSKEIMKYGNPGSHTQLKEWLFSLGWKPETFKTSDATGKEIPQISLPFGKGICPSVKKLYKKEPNLKELEGLFVARHRLSIFDGYLTKVRKDGHISAGAHGFTRSLRLKHAAPIVNLPSIEKYYGEEIRGALSVKDKKHNIFAGFDLSALEDKTKMHYIYYFDPDYVTAMSSEDFDAHLDISVLSELVTKDEMHFYKWYDAKKDKKPKAERLIKNVNPNFLKLSEKEQLDLFHKIGTERSKGKRVNFAATYNAQVTKISTLLDDDVKLAQKLFDTYWERNWAIKKICENVVIKKIKGQKWLYNPVSKFWYSLKAEKDIFSLLNQSTGNFVFNTFLMCVIQKCLENNITYTQQLQYHDEALFLLKKDQIDKFKNIILPKAIEKTNNKLKLNVDFGYSLDIGYSYAECH